MDTKHQEVNSKIFDSAKDIIALASEMISIPSPTGQEGPMAAWLEKWLGSNGFDVESFIIDPDLMENRYKSKFYRWTYPYSNRPNILGIKKGAGNGPSLMINFHLDVVDASPDKWRVDPWKGTEKDGFLFGRGACDMKGGAAAALFAIKTILDSGIALEGDILIAGVIEEEGPGNGTFALQANGIRADACIIPEPTDMALAIGVTGGIYGFINILGKSAHSSTPWNGVNALEKGYLLLEGINKWRQERKKIPPDPLFIDEPETPAAAHIIDIKRTDEGLIGKIPASVQLMVRSTVMPGEDPWDLADKFEKTILAETSQDSWLAKKPPDFTWLRVGGRNYPARLSADHPLCKTLMDAYFRITGNESKLSGLVSPADMQQLMNFEPVTPTLMFGPGSIYTAHTDDECVPIEDLVKVSAVLADFIINWCGVAE